MPNATYALSTAVSVRSLRILGKLLHMAEAHAIAHKIDPAVLLSARLFPDMYPVTRQVQIACDTAKRTTARIARVEAPSYPDDETSFAELYERIEKTVAFIAGQPQDGVAASEPVEFKLGPNTIKLSADDYVIRFGLPNFYFHVITVYNILRHNGVALGKLDFLGDVASGQV